MPQQKSYKILLIGDSCIDKYVYGTCDRLNPEAPVPVLNYSREHVSLGMALNVRENLNAFGVDIDVITNKETIVKTRYIDERYNQQILRVDEEQVISPMSFHLLEENYDAIVISDYNKGFVSQNKLFDIVNSSDIPVFIDSKKTELPKSKCFIKVNESESKLLNGNYENLIITRGGNGAEYNGVLYAGEKVNVFDVVGAGDTFLSALVVFYLKYGTIERAIPYANKAAAIAVQHRGTYVLTEEDVNEICN
jgi:bifunctional ADP-heptose synthase (sugar kinase/adenylyltransferase)